MGIATIFIKKATMKLDANKFTLASAISFTWLWIICSIIVVLLPGFMLGMSGHMLHWDFSSMG